MDWGLTWSVAGGVASVAGIAALAYGAGRRKAGREIGSADSPTVWMDPDDAWARFLRDVADEDAGNVDIIGYSVHEILDRTQPIVKRALSTGHRVRVLSLEPASEALHEKSAAEHGGRGAALNISDFRSRTRDNINKVFADLQALKQQVSYQYNLANVDLSVRTYDAFPLLRGISAGPGRLVAAYYLADPARPGRLLPHAVLSGPESDTHSLILRANFNEWFSYIWTQRSKPAHLRVVAFDLYETLVRVDREAQRACRARMADLLGVPVQSVDDAWQATTADSNRGLLPDLPDRMMRLQQLVGAARDYDVAVQLSALERELLRNNVKVYPGAVEVLGRLRRAGYKTALVSNCSSSVIHSLRASLPTHLFDHFVLSYMEGHLKPEREIYQLLLDAGPYLPAECIFVGDGNNDELIGAQACGLRTVKLSHHQDETPGRGDANIYSLIDLIPAIERSFV